MSLPGFTAEVSLRRTRDYYQMVEIVTQTDRSIQAASIKGRGCYSKCLEEQCVGDNDLYCEDNCRCICYGHPGRTCWLQ